MTKVNALLLEAALLKTSILIVILAIVYNTNYRNHHHHHQNTHNRNRNRNCNEAHHMHNDNNVNTSPLSLLSDPSPDRLARPPQSSGLILLASAYRVPYQYPRYPRLRKEYPANVVGGSNSGATRYAAAASALDSSIVANIETNEVVHVDMRIRDNSQAHHTQLYEMIDRVNPLNPTGPALVLRRGDPITVVIHLRNNYQRNTDKIRLEFSFGPRPQVGKGTLIYLPITNDRDYTRDNTKWDAKVLRADGNVLTIQIHIPANIAIGIWRFKISTKLAGSRSIKTYSIKEALYVIFNSWSKDDAVYLSSEDARKEYVLNDVGKIYIGSHSKPRGRKWIYGQFHEAVLPAVMFMLDKTRLDIVGRSNVVKVARAVSAMVNSHDDNGLLVGNWSGNYGDGLAPWQWTGSATILEKYLQTGGEPVKFGQCWVFAGVTTTVLRTLGIPARTVSNFVSAHDTDDSLTVDKFFSEKGDPISDVNSDSIWNFHVWSDAWMARTDLPPGYGGWQAVDATPQETSMGMYQMGPASLEAIRKGEVGFAYDAAFVFAEVNADVVHWQQDDKSDLQWRKIKTNKYHVGRKIFTKRIGMLDDYTATGVADAEDIISQYKNKEGTEEERMSVLNAARCGGLGFLFEQPAPGKEDVEFDLIDIDKVMVGQPFFVVVKVINRSDFRRTITIALSASSVFYTGILAQKVKRDRQSITLNGRQEQVLRIRVGSDDYIDKLVDYSMMKIYAIATVKETQQTWSEEDDFMIEKPQLLVQTHGQLMVNKKFDLEIRFTNPLEQRLTSCGFTVEGPGLAQPLQIAYRDILPLETISHIESFVPRKAGPRTILVAFHSAQLIDVIGSKQVQIYQQQQQPTNSNAIAASSNPNALLGVAPSSGSSSSLSASDGGSSSSLIDNTDNTGSLASEVASVDEGEDPSTSGLSASSGTATAASSGSSALTDSSSDSVTR